MFLFADSLFVAKDHQGLSKELHMRHEDVIFLSSCLLFGFESDDYNRNAYKDEIDNLIWSTLESSPDATIEEVASQVYKNISSTNFFDEEQFLGCSFLRNDDIIVLYKKGFELNAYGASCKIIDLAEYNDSLQCVSIAINTPNQSIWSPYVKWSLNNRHNSATPNMEAVVGCKVVGAVLGLLGHRLRILAHNLFLHSEIKTALLSLLFCSCLFYGINSSMPIPRGVAEQMQAMTFRFMGDLASIENSAQALRHENTHLHNMLEELELQLTASYAETNAIEAALIQTESDLQDREMSIQLKNTEITSLQQRALNAECMLDAIANKINLISKDLDIPYKQDSSDPCDQLLKIYGLIAASISNNEEKTNDNFVPHSVADNAVMDLICNYDLKVDELAQEVASLKQQRTTLMKEMELHQKNYNEMLAAKQNYEQELANASCSSERLWLDNKNMQSKISMLKEQIKQLSDKVSAQNSVIQQLNLANRMLSTGQLSI